MGRHAEARRHYSAALKIVPNEPDVLSNLGLSYALEKKLKLAEKTLRRSALAAASPYRCSRAASVFWRNLPQDGRRAPNPGDERRIPAVPSGALGPAVSCQSARRRSAADNAGPRRQTAGRSPRGAPPCRRRANPRPVWCTGYEFGATPSRTTGTWPSPLPTERSK